MNYRQPKYDIDILEQNDSKLTQKPSFSHFRTFWWNPNICYMLGFGDLQATLSWYCDILFVIPRLEIDMGTQMKSISQNVASFTIIWYHNRIHHLIYFLEMYTFTYYSQIFANVQAKTDTQNLNVDTVLKKVSYPCCWELYQRKI